MRYMRKKKKEVWVHPLLSNYESKNTHLLLKEKQRMMRGLKSLRVTALSGHYPEIKSLELVRDKSLFLARRELGRSIFMGIIAISYREMVITITRLMRE